MCITDKYFFLKSRLNRLTLSLSYHEGFSNAWSAEYSPITDVDLLNKKELRAIQLILSHMKINISSVNIAIYKLNFKV